MKRLHTLIAILLSTALLLPSACKPAHSPAAEPTAEPGLTVYFIDVGQAESSLIICCHGTTMLIDGGNPSDSRIINAYLDELGITRLDYVVASHSDADHVGGLSGVLDSVTVGVALSPVSEHNSGVFNSFVDSLDRQNVDITVPRHGDTFQLGGADVLIVAPIREYRKSNDTSIVMKVTFGDTSYLFTGDAERASELDILDAGYDISSTVLSVGHHGSNTSTTYSFLQAVMPQYAVISCGLNNRYGHPDEETLSLLNDAGAAVYRSDLQGTIVSRTDGSNVTFSVERDGGIEALPPTSSASAEETHYIGNTNSKIIHRPSCSSLPSEKNRVIFNTLEEGIGGGYSPCGRCKP